MRLGFSSYSFEQRLRTGAMSLIEVIDWIAEHDGEHLEFAVIDHTAASSVPNLAWPSQEVEEIIEHAARRGIALSNLAVGADLSITDENERAEQLQRLKDYVELAHRLGIDRIRHDVVSHAGRSGDDVPAFEEAFAAIVDGCREVARHAAQFQITTSLENHGFFVQSSDRVRRIVHAVDEPNFATTLDIGNFLCVDEDPVAAVTANLPYASIVHFKDFYVRPADAELRDGWFRSRAGKQLRGAIVGEGDLDLPRIAAAVRASGYDGYVSIEFEGHEDCLLGCRRGLANARHALTAA